MTPSCAPATTTAARSGSFSPVSGAYCGSRAAALVIDATGTIRPPGSWTIRASGGSCGLTYVAGRGGARSVVASSTGSLRYSAAYDRAPSLNRIRARSARDSSDQRGSPTWKVRGLPSAPSSTTFRSRPAASSYRDTTTTVDFRAPADLGREHARCPRPRPFGAFLSLVEGGTGGEVEERRARQDGADPRAEIPTRASARPRATRTIHRSRFASAASVATDASSSRSSRRRRSGRCAPFRAPRRDFPAPAAMILQPQENTTSSSRQRSSCPFASILGRRSGYAARSRGLFSTSSMMVARR